MKKNSIVRYIKYYLDTLSSDPVKDTLKRFKVTATDIRGAVIIKDVKDYLGKYERVIDIDWICEVKE